MAGFSEPLVGEEPSDVFARLSRSSKRLLSFLPVGKSVSLASQL